MAGKGASNYPSSSSGNKSTIPPNLPLFSNSHKLFQNYTQSLPTNANELEGYHTWSSVPSAVALASQYRYMAHERDTTFSEYSAARSSAYPAVANIGHGYSDLMNEQQAALYNSMASNITGDTISGGFTSALPPPFDNSYYNHATRYTSSFS